MRILKIASLLISSIIVIFTGSLITFSCISSAQQNRIINFVAKKALSIWHPKWQFSYLSVDLKNSSFLVKNIEANIGDFVIKIPTITANYNIGYKVSQFNISFSSIQINQTLIEQDFSVQYTTDITMQNQLFKLNLANETEKQNKCEIQLIDDKITFNACEFESSARYQIKIDGSMQKNLETIDIKSEFSGIDLTSYKLLKIISPSIIDFNFWDDFIKQGQVCGNLHVNLSSKQVIDKNSLHGDLTFSNSKVKYSDKFPLVEDIKAQATIEGKKISAKILQGRSNKVEINNGVIDFQWIDKINSVIKIDLNIGAKSPSLNDFISDQQKAKLKQQDIDFSKTNGDVVMNVKMDVPLAPQQANIVNISGSINNFQVKAFKNLFNMTKANFAIFINNDGVFAKGPGLINGYPIIIDYKQDTPYTKSKLEADIKLQGKPNQLSHFINFDGVTTLNLIYEDSKDSYSIDAKANLTKIGIFSDKLNISKPKGVECSFKAKKDIKNNNLLFLIKSKESLALEGSINTDSKALDIKTFYTDKIRLAGNLKLDGDIIKTNIVGSYLDLADYNFFNLLKKERSEFGLELDVQFQQVLLKNEQMLNDIDIKIRCDKEKCFEGRGMARSSTDLIIMSLDSKDSYETWNIKSKDAGSFLKALGLYSKIKKGKMILNASTQRKAVKTGEVLPIMKGTLLIKDFSAIKNPVITKIVSITSIPGIIDIITNNKEIKFDSLNAEFDFYQDVISLSSVDIMGPSFDLGAKGDIDIQNRQIRLKGSLVPSIYYINSMLKMTPILGKLFSGKKRGVIAAPFNVKEKY